MVRKERADGLLRSQENYSVLVRSTPTLILPLGSTTVRKIFQHNLILPCVRRNKRNKYDITKPLYAGLCRVFADLVNARHVYGASRNRIIESLMKRTRSQLKSTGACDTILRRNPANTVDSVPKPGMG